MKKYNKVFIVRNFAGAKKEMTVSIPDLTKSEVYKYMSDRYPEFKVRRMWVSVGDGVVADALNPNLNAFG